MEREKKVPATMKISKRFHWTSLFWSPAKEKQRNETVGSGSTEAASMAGSGDVFAKKRRRNSSLASLRSLFRLQQKTRSNTSDYSFFGDGDDEHAPLLDYDNFYGKWDLRDDIGNEDDHEQPLLSPHTQASSLTTSEDTEDCSSNMVMA